MIKLLILLLLNSPAHAQLSPYHIQPGASTSVNIYEEAARMVAQDPYEVNANVDSYDESTGVYTKYNTMTYESSNSDGMVCKNIYSGLQCIYK